MFSRDVAALLRSAAYRPSSLGSRVRAWRNGPARRIGRALRGQKEASFVQIGSNDGKTGDPLHHLLIRNRSWRALFVEPVPFLFERLRNNYPSEGRFRFENVAIGRDGETLPFFYVSESAQGAIEGLPKHFDQLGSFNPDHIRRHLGDRIDPFVVRVEIRTASLTSVLERHGIEAIDVLHIDTEGNDGVILRQLDLSRFQPKVILFEHKHLSGEDKAISLEFLGSRYDATDLGCDYFCLRR